MMRQLAAEAFKIFDERFHNGGVRIELENQVIINRDPVAILLGDTKTMRTTLTIEVRYDTKLNDDERREAFLKLALMRGRELYGQAAMLADKPPEVTVVTIGRDGKKTYPLFVDGNPGE